ncbi:glutamate-1-semialdehyde 2,1-aminomutase [Alkalibaculum sp. M08DMB]|uniref:Glutamate-1-semialdehyde 2,1-aminomutase n=1 Tax=Alkalibaculum sporogenes TaxID=2655001 RepID=A0A6A7K9R9_9FIRM|nr:glutamate-1-semialdehyde 2,1-aminomutase [Alkalibaculum sporogenes]MPW26279.1 glutamate-1-semialdehyde 2,1-aminomutase [Alkalibaculum sporogenes]
MNFSKSEELFKEANKYIPGGVNSPVRAFQSVGMSSIFASKGKGSKITDVDGNEFIDYICSWGPLILGHSSEIVYKGIEKVFEEGITYGLATEMEIKVAKLIVDAYPSVEMIRMVNSGTEATMSALRLARGYTNRSKVLKFEGCYHGHSDGLLVKSGSGTLTYGSPTSSGVSEDAIKNTLVGQYNDAKMLEEIFKIHGKELAAVIIEPVAGNMGVVPANEEFLITLRKLTEEYGVVLIFDEVITGFRVSFGGAQEVYNIKPDITCFGKIIGGGLPVGAFGGKREIMEMLAPLGSVYQAGTLSGNPLAMLLGFNCLTYLKENPEMYNKIEQLAIELEKGMIEHIKEFKVEASVNRFKGMLNVFFTGEKVQTFEDVSKCDTKVYEKYFKLMLDCGILLPPAQFEGMFLSTAHTKEDVEKTLEANKKAMSLL